MSTRINRTEDEIKEYYRGKRNGVWLYAYMKDGTYYLGTTGTTWRSAKAKIDEQEKEALEDHALHTP